MGYVPKDPLPESIIPDLPHSNLGTDRITPEPDRDTVDSAFFGPIFVLNRSSYEV